MTEQLSKIVIFALVISISASVITVSSTAEFFSYTRINSLLVMEVNKVTIIIVVLYIKMDFPGGSDGKASAYST